MTAILFAATVTVHHTKSDGGDQRDDKGNGKEVDDHGHLGVVVVGGHHHRLVFAGIETGEDGALAAVQGIKALAGDGGRVAAAFDIDEERGLLRLRPVSGVIGEVGHVLGNCNVLFDKCHIDMNTSIEIRGAALATGAPGAVEDTHQVLAPSGRAEGGLLHEIVA